ncbi:MAG: twin-arginine translocation signal domain-containing protein, partial [Planctomycetales bacterium]|nr:twin-arginine translocation signal domain-containing protein [Planctomycetales bacterium]
MTLHLPSYLAERDRRSFLKSSAITVAGAACIPAVARAAEATSSAPESLVKVLYESLSPAQRESVCYDWNYQDPKRGLLRTRVAANWKMNSQEVMGEFYTDEQRDLIRKIFEGIVDPQWHAKFDQQMDDDCGGFGHEQSIGIFGKPGDD